MIVSAASGGEREGEKDFLNQFETSKMKGGRKVRIASTSSGKEGRGRHLKSYVAVVGRKEV